MVADIKVNINTIQIKNFLSSLRRKQKSAINSALSRVSNMAILMITKRTQSGRLPDGGKMKSYAKSTKVNRRKRGRCKSN